jgi:hypothetical protein
MSTIAPCIRRARQVSNCARLGAGYRLRHVWYALPPDFELFNDPDSGREPGAACIMSVPREYFSFTFPFDGLDRSHEEGSALTSPPKLAAGQAINVNTAKTSHRHSSTSRVHLIIDPSTDSILPSKHCRQPTAADLRTSG